jgi:hypothetical protein
MDRYLRRKDGRLEGKPEMGLAGASRYLLSRMLVCGVCRARLIATKRIRKSGRPFVYFVCGTRRTRGVEACPNERGVREDLITAMIVRAFQRMS